MYIKTVWFCAALIIAAGGGYGLSAMTAPSQLIIQPGKLAQLECEQQPRMARGKVINTPDGGL